MRPSTILLVEDDPHILFILERIIQQVAPSCTVVLVEDPQQVLPTLRDGVCPLMITDYNMPGMTGIDLTRLVKSQYPTLQVLLITAYTTPTIEQLARAAGVDYFLAKPFSFDGLSQILTTILQALDIPTTTEPPVQQAPAKKRRRK